MRNQKVELRVAVEDDEQGSETLEIAWASSRNCDVMPTAFQAGSTFSLTPSALGPYCIWARARDDQGATDTSPKFELMVENQPPIGHIEIVKSPRATGDGGYELYGEFQLSASKSSDPDKDPLTHRWKLIRPSGETTEGRDAELSFRATAPGRYSVELIATDDQMRPSELASRVLMVAEDRPPCITGIEPDLKLLKFPEDPMKQRTLSVTEVDDDGDPFQVDVQTQPFVWSLRRGTDQTWGRLPVKTRDFTLPPNVFRVGEIVQVRVQYNDRVNRDLSACERATPQPALCELKPGSTCYQWITWTVEYRL